MDFQHLASQLEMDEAEFMELVELFVATSLSDISKIKTALEADCSPDAALAAHSIKGAAANMGFGEISKMAAQMETKAKQGDLQDIQTLVIDIEHKVNTLIK